MGIFAQLFYEDFQDWLKGDFRAFGGHFHLDRVTESKEEHSGNDEDDQLVVAKEAPDFPAEGSQGGECFVFHWFLRWVRDPLAHTPDD